MNSLINTRRDLAGGACRHQLGAYFVKSHMHPAQCGFCVFVFVFRWIEVAYLLV